MTMIALLNKFALKRIQDYQGLRIARRKINCPYFINNFDNFLTDLLKDGGGSNKVLKTIIQAYHQRSIPFGWYLGKGTPEEITEATKRVAEEWEISLDKASEQGIVEFMKLAGLGIDCSGFIYNVVTYAFNRINKLEELKNSLNWISKTKTAEFAGAFIFDDKASEKIPLASLQPLDLVLIKNKGLTIHLGIFIRKEKELKYAQSNFNTVPSGVTISDFFIKDQTPIFKLKKTMGSNLTELYKTGGLEFRRLKILSSKCIS